MLVTVMVSLMPAMALGRVFTPLEVDNHPCSSEKLKNTVSYSCDPEGNVSCNNGWKDSDPNHLDPLHRCSEPVCEPACKKGECRAPNRCACEIGWEGSDCNKCITKPGCVHGKCETKALECVCSEGYEGGFCDRPSCPQDCGPNGFCYSPGRCSCHKGWEGNDCKQCKVLSGCQHGDCVDRASNASSPNSCICEPGWEGHLCDQPKCTPECTEGNGECWMIGGGPRCICAAGFTGATCSECMVYPGCPTGGTCQNPYDCDCSNVDEPDRNVLCGIHDIHV